MSIADAPRIVKVQIAIAAITAAVTVWASFTVAPALQQAQQAKRDVELLTQQKAKLQNELDKTQSTIDSLQKVSVELETDQKAALAVIGEVLQAPVPGEKEDERIIDPLVNFSDVQDDFNSLPPGRRKRAMFIAFLMAWKRTPFVAGGSDPANGLGSPEFLLYVLHQIGISIPRPAGTLASQALENALTKVEENQAQVGDIVMYRGGQGHYGVFIVSQGARSNGKIGLGSYNASLPIQVRSLSRGDRTLHPVIGYYHVNYEG